MPPITFHLYIYLILAGIILFLMLWVYRKSNKIKTYKQQLLDLTKKYDDINQRIDEGVARAGIEKKDLNGLLDVFFKQKRKHEELINTHDVLLGQMQKARLVLSKTSSELIKHDLELNQLHYTISHNLRGPITRLEGLINVLEKEKLSQENLQVIIAYLRNSIHDLLEVSNDLKSISDLRNKMFSSRENIHIEELINQVLAFFEDQINEFGIEVKLDLQIRHFFTIPQIVHNVLYNLISNAIKFHSSDRKPIIEIRTSLENDTFLLSVWDNGLGVDLDRFSQKIFQPYNRFHLHKEGKGLGLFLVKLQSELLGGQVSIASEVDKYCEIKVLINH